MNKGPLRGLLGVLAAAALAGVVVWGWSSLSSENDKTQAQLTSELTVLRQETGLATQTMQLLETNLATANSKLDDLGQAISSVQADVGRTRDELASSTATLTGALEAAAAQADDLDDDVTALKAEDRVLDTRVGDVQTDLGLLTEGMTRLQQNVATLTTQVAIGSASAGGSGVIAATRTFTIGPLSVQVTPSASLSGQDTAFVVAGLQPWQSVSVSHLRPTGAPAPWIIPNLEATYSSSQAQEDLYADAAGRVGWTRVGTQDGEGTWRVQLAVDGASYAVPYQVSELQLTTNRVQRFGLDLRRYQGLASDMYYSSGVPSALVLELQAHLYNLRSVLRERFGFQSRVIPDLYLFGDRGLFEAAGRTIEVNVTWEAGFHLTGGSYPGIYVQADKFLSTVKEILTHEYVHLIVGEISSVRIPAWLNEGTARYYELHLGLESARPDHARTAIYDQADEARSALTDGLLPSLPSLEDRVAWNNVSATQADQNYAHAYMAVRFFIQEHGETALAALITSLASDQPLGEAVLDTTGQNYAAFEQAFRAWLRTWQDPERELVRQYNQAANGLVDELSMIGTDRATQVQLDAGGRLDAGIPPWTQYVARAADLQRRAAQLRTPDGYETVQSGLTAFCDRTVTWLQRELEYFQTGVDTTRVQANNMIPEVDARSALMQRTLGDLAFVYRLD
ncbi:MAG: hypothetical protein EXR48_04890 [Dehalococcoidia bacterium]|nr:hypothetical protein [Dehalococcoidia bacterium]